MARLLPASRGGGGGGVPSHAPVGDNPCDGSGDAWQKSPVGPPLHRPICFLGEGFLGLGLEIDLLPRDDFTGSGSALRSIPKKPTPFLFSVLHPIRVRVPLGKPPSSLFPFPFPSSVFESCCVLLGFLPIGD